MESFNFLGLVNVLGGLLMVMMGFGYIKVTPRYGYEEMFAKMINIMKYAGIFVLVGGIFQLAVTD